MMSDSNFQATILIIDDLEVNRYAMGRVLERAGIRVIQAASGTEGLAMARQKPDLILLDVQMPDLDGFEVCRRIKADPLTANIPVLHISADFVAREDKINGLQSGADGYLVQPIGPDELLANVQTRLRVHQTEKALRASEARYRDLVQNVPCVIQHWKCDGTLTFFNKYAQDLFGYHEDEVLGRHVGMMLPDRESTGADLTGLVQDIVDHPERYKNFVNENVCKDGRRVWINWTNQPIRDEQGHVVGVLAVGTDITERKRAEMELRQLKDELEMRVEQRTAELAAANGELESFGYTVSHDLRAPLRHITGYIQLLLLDAADSLDEQGREYLKIISDSAQHMGCLIDDLLALSRLGRANMAERTVRLDSLVDEALRELEPETRDRVIEWRIAPLPEVNGDPTLLRNAVINLLSNAIKYSRQRARAVIEIGSRMGDGETVCYVRDNGAGFDMRFADKLFGVFQRLHPAELFEGTGIGLASTRRIIERHGGRVWAEGEVDQGATFYFSLPMNKGAMTRDGNQAHPAGGR